MNAITRSSFIVGSAAGAAALAAPVGAADFPKPEISQLRVGVASPGTSFLPFYIAQARTWAQQGLDVSMLEFRGDAEAAQALSGNSVDIFLGSLNGVIDMVSAGQPVIGFYAGFYQSDFSWLAQPSIKKWSDLKGKTAEVSTFGSLVDALTRFELQKHGLKPETDVQIIQAGGAPSAYETLKSGRVGLAILPAPFKWQAAAEGFTLMGTQAGDVAAQWPKHMIAAKTDFIHQNPHTIEAFLRAHVAAIRLARAQRDVAVQILVDHLKYSHDDAEKAYDDVINGYNERGTLPDRFMPIFWRIMMSAGVVKAPLPDAQILDPRFINSFSRWAPS